MRGIDLSRPDDRRQLAWMLAWTADRTRTQDLLAATHCVLAASPGDETVRRQALNLCRDLVFPAVKKAAAASGFASRIAAYEARFGKPDHESLRQTMANWVQKRKSQGRRTRQRGR